MNSMTLGIQMQTHGSAPMKSDVVMVVIYFSSIIKETIAESASVTVSPIIAMLIPWRNLPPLSGHNEAGMRFIYSFL